MLEKAPSIPADEVLLDLEDSVAPSAKKLAREAVVDALNAGDWDGKTVAVRINSIDSQWAADDLRAVVFGAGPSIDCIVVPKVDSSDHVMFAHHLLRMSEASAGVDKRIGIEALIETATGLRNVWDIASCSDRLEALIFGPADMSASLGLPAVTAGPSPEGYPGDHWHWVLETILVAARSANLQAIDGPYLSIKDVEGLRDAAIRASALGYDGKWALHPTQVGVLNEVFTPRQEAYEKAESILEAYGHATDVDRRGAVMFGTEMIDEASRKMAMQLALRGRAAGLKRSKGLEDFPR
jgi:citrate lyase subunit beta / citryl-CoA lyase